jgi:hypothetical protein
MKPVIAATVLLAFGVLAAAQAPRGRGRGAVPAPLTLEANLVVAQDTYTLPAARIGEEFRKQTQTANRAGNAMPAPPDVDLTLELKNTGAAPVVVTLDADSCRVNLKLEGPGAVNVDANVMMTMEFRGGRQATIDPGKSLSIPIKSLRHGLRGISKLAYWTEPGEYTLTASYTTHPPDLNDQTSTIEAPPVKIKVAAGK